MTHITLFTNFPLLQSEISFLFVFVVLEIKPIFKNFLYVVYKLKYSKFHFIKNQLNFFLKKLNKNIYSYLSGKKEREREGE